MNRLLTGILVLAFGTGTAAAEQATDTTGPHVHDHAVAQAAAPVDAAAPQVKDPTFLTLVKPGDRIRMPVERIDGALTIVALQRVP
jgi:acyl dehydratase